MWVLLVLPKEGSNIALAQCSQLEFCFELGTDLWVDFLVSVILQAAFFFNEIHFLESYYLIQFPMILLALLVRERLLNDVFIWNVHHVQFMVTSEIISYFCSCWFELCHNGHNSFCNELLVVVCHIGQNHYTLSCCLLPIFLESKAKL